MTALADAGVVVLAWLVVLVLLLLVMRAAAAADRVLGDLDVDEPIPYVPAGDDDLMALADAVQNPMIRGLDTLAEAVAVEARLQRELAKTDLRLWELENGWAS